MHFPTSSETAPIDPKPGRYLHYKNLEYVVLTVARHSETNEWHVVYQQQYGDRSIWVRPRNMFLEQVKVEGKMVPRFAYIGPN